jgi:hypothetical protein
MRKITASSAVVLIVGSSCFAGLVHNQITTIGLTNAIDLLHGSQQANSLQNLVVDNKQAAEGTATENLFSSLGQVGNAQGNCALLGLQQKLNIAGTQGQNVGDNLDPKAQMQGLGLVATQTLAKSDGEGMGDALHTIVLSAGQTADNVGGNLTETQTLMGMQTPQISGEAGATAITNTGMSVTNSQTQQTM